jgi:hypothetical protein
MASKITLEEYAKRPKTFTAWVDQLPDDEFNQLWDAMKHETCGKNCAAMWLRSLGYEDATAGRVVGVMGRERR